MAVLRVVLDSCVMFPMYLRDTLLCTAEAGLYQPHWSQEILDGATRNLVSQGTMTVERAISLETKIKKAFAEAMIEVPVELAQVMTNHPSDLHVLAAAVTAKADIIVTSNLKHFQAKDLDPWNIKAQSPDDFLTYLYDLYLDRMVEVVRRQSQVLKKPPMTIAELLALLSKRDVPKFASNVLFYEYSLGVVQTTKKALEKIGKKALEGVDALKESAIGCGSKAKLSQSPLRTTEGRFYGLRMGKLRGISHLRILRHSKSLTAA